MTRLNTRARLGTAAYGIESESAQCLGKHVIEFAYIPFTPAGNELPFLVDADAFLYPPLAHRILSQPSASPQTLIREPFAWDEPNIAFSAFKRAEDGDGYILRLYEMLGKAVTACIHLDGFQTAIICQMDESHLAPLEVQDGCIRVEFAPHKIVSLRLR
jgi:alpha-mannosidase